MKADVLQIIVLCFFFPNSLPCDLERLEVCPQSSAVKAYIHCTSSLDPVGMVCIVQFLYCDKFLDSPLRDVLPVLIIPSASHGKITIRWQGADSENKFNKTPPNHAPASIPAAPSTSFAGASCCRALKRRSGIAVFGCFLLRFEICQPMPSAFKAWVVNLLFRAR